MVEYQDSQSQQPPQQFAQPFDLIELLNDFVEPRYRIQDSIIQKDAILANLSDPDIDLLIHMGHLLVLFKHVEKKTGRTMQYPRELAMRMRHIITFSRARKGFTFNGLTTSKFQQVQPKQSGGLLSGFTGGR